jgi:nitroreductase
METEKSIAGRRSVRSYLDKPVPQETVEKILKAGAMAPSAMDKQPCRFIVISDKGKIKALSDRVKEKIASSGLLGGRMRTDADIIFHGAPLLIFVVAEKNEWAAIDCSLAAQNMMLQGYDLGLGSCYIGFARIFLDHGALSEIGVTESQELYCPLIFGYPREWPKPKDRVANVQKRFG